MTTPVAATRVQASGKTQQGRTPSPSPTAKGQFRPPARSTVSTAPVQSSAPAQSRTRQRKAPARPTGGAQRQRRQIGQSAARGARTAATGSLTDWQKVIAAEFILAELLIALTPMTSKKQATDVSPYVPRDMTKMIAVGAVFFLLELLSIPAGWGRGMAAFGGLILLAVGLNEGANVARDIDAFAGIKTTAAKVKEKVTDA